jgi:hypothetical protein
VWSARTTAARRGWGNEIRGIHTSQQALARGSDSMAAVNTSTGTGSTQGESIIAN